MFLSKKVGDFNKKESESLDFTGVKIPRDHGLGKEDMIFLYHIKGNNGFYTKKAEFTGKCIGRKKC